MARLARADLFDPAEVSVVHCINRCVRRCFLCGCDPLTGKNYEHRKAWLEERLEFLAGQFGIDVQDWQPLVARFSCLFYRVTGAPWCAIKSRTSWQFRRGRAELLGRR